MIGFAAKISIMCFAASYAVSFLLEISRLWFRSGVRGAVMLGFAIAGFIAHTLFLIHRSVTETSIPLSTPYDWYLLIAWVLMLFYFYFTFCHKTTASGLFVFPLVFVLIAVAEFAAEKVPFAQESITRTWGMVHGIFLLLGTAAVLIGCVAGLMYLMKSRRLKNKQLASQGLQLPSLEWLEKSGEQAIIWSIFWIGLGLLSGIVLNMFRPHIAWTDPVIWTSGLLFAWVVVMGVFNVFYRPARRGQKVAYLTLATFGFLMFQLGFSLLYPTEHGNKKRQDASQQTSHKKELNPLSLQKYSEI